MRINFRTKMINERNYKIIIVNLYQQSFKLNYIIFINKQKFQYQVKSIKNYY